jgi:plastocyanin
VAPGIFGVVKATSPTRELTLVKSVITLAFAALAVGLGRDPVLRHAIPEYVVPAGIISGTVTLEPAPRARRTVDRYSGSTATVMEQSLSAIVYLKGTIPGPVPAGYDSNPTMSQQDSVFVPSTLAVVAGSTVSFPNGDPLFHNVFSYSGPKHFDLGRYPQGDSKDVVFDEPGLVEVFCEVHDHMAGAILVTENPFHAVVSEDGSFSISGVPPGEYTLAAWHPEHDEAERTITVTDGATTQVEVELQR